MSVDGLLVLQRSDLAHLADHPQRFGGQRLLFVDPGLLDEAAVRGLRDCHMRRLAVGADFQARAYTTALARATLIDQQLTLERERLWPGAVLSGWDVGVFFLALQRAAVTSQRRLLIEQSFPERRIGVLRPDVVQQMYFDSFISTDLMTLDAARFCVLDSYTQTRWFRADAYEHVFDVAALRTLLGSGRVSAITHVPTCFYDRAWLSAEVARSHSHTIDLPSPFWDVPVHRGGPLQRPLSGGARHAHASSEAIADIDTDADAALALRYRERAAVVLHSLLADLLPQPLARERQLQAWADRCHWQALNFAALRQALRGQRPQFLLSDQDTGLNGPLCSVAAECDAEVTVMPHSGHPSMVFPHARRVTAVERAGYGTRPRTVQGQNVAVRAVHFGHQRVAAAASADLSERQFDAQPGVQRLCLLLNSMQTEGLSHVDAHALAEFHRPLAALCQAAGVELILRPKPGAPALSVLASALGVDAALLLQHTTRPLEQLAQECALVVAYGEPTTGVAPFLDLGRLVLQVHSQCWPTDYLVCMPLVQDGVIPLLDHSQGLARVQALLNDAQQFEQERAAQAAAVCGRAAGAHEHLFADAVPFGPGPGPGLRPGLVPVLLAVLPTFPSPVLPSARPPVAAQSPA